MKQPSLALATTYDAHDPALLAGVLPYVQFLEVTPDSIARRRGGGTELHPDILNDLRAVADRVGFLVHGVGLSIGSWEGWSEDYLVLLRALLDHVDPIWHSEHLGYLKVGGENLNTMLAVPRTREMLDLLVPRIQALHDEFQRPFLLEHIIHLLPDAPAEYTEAEFLNRLTGETGCGLILDVYNLECDAANYGFDVPAFFRELDFRPVREIHLAGGVDYKGFKLDIHSSRVADSTLALAERALGFAARAEVLTYEILPQAVAVHGPDLVVEELDRLTHFFQLHRNEPAPTATNHARPAQIAV